MTTSFNASQPSNGNCFKFNEFKLAKRSYVLPAQIDHKLPEGGKSTIFIIVSIILCSELGTL